MNKAYENRKIYSSKGKFGINTDTKVKQKNEQKTRTTRTRQKPEVRPNGRVGLSHWYPKIIHADCIYT